MLKSLEIKGVGPAPELILELGRRLNLITGDNGLGKSFLLDIAWWAQTRRWPIEVNPQLASGYMARPAGSGKATIGFAFTGKAKTERYVSEFDRKEQAWTGRPGRPANPGLVLYAQVDGSFSVWDPARNYWKKRRNVDIQERQPAYVFSPKQVWEGLRGDDGTWLCNGLIRDWAGWQKENGDAFKLLTAVLETLSPSTGEAIAPGRLTRISLEDSRDMPTLLMPYGDAVPVVYASAGMRRIIALVYLLVWTWEEHLRASELLGQEPTDQVVFLIDEIEAHLHPRWQRSVVTSLLTVVRQLAKTAKVQLVAATHSPLVLASVETEFSEGQDAWFDLDVVRRAEATGMEVVLTRRAWVRHGEVSNWLMSEAFDLKSARSLEAERLLEEAALALSDEALGARRARALETRLHQVLGDTDPFWVRWRYVAEKRGWRG